MHGEQDYCGVCTYATFSSYTDIVANRKIRNRIPKMQQQGTHEADNDPQISLTLLSSLPRSPSGSLRWELFLSIGSDLLPRLPRQVRGWPCLLLDHPGPWIIRPPLQLHLFRHLRPDGHGGASGRLHQPGGGTL